MKAEFWINFKAKKLYGGLALAGSPKTSTKKPNIHHDEVCMKMVLEIPDLLFEKPVITLNGKLGVDFTQENQITIANEAKALIEKKLGITCEIKE